MKSKEEIKSIFTALSERYDRISVSTIKGLLKGQIKVRGGKGPLLHDKEKSPNLNEVETAFLTQHCAILTAFRGSYNLPENIARNEELKHDMESLGLSYKPVRGCYREADQEYVNIEYCFFIYTENNASIFFSQVYSLSEKYEQDSFLYKRSGINRTAFLVATTDAGRKDLNGDIKFAGQLFLHVPDVEAWTDCSDGRFAFQLKGMVLTGTGNKKIHLGEGNIFDINGYGATGLVIIRTQDEVYLKEECNSIPESVKVAQHVFKGESSSSEYLHKVIFECLKVLRDSRCKRIGFHCSASLDGSTLNAAAVAYESIHLWAKRYSKKFEWIVIDDPKGEYARALKDRKADNN